MAHDDALSFRSSPETSDEGQRRAASVLLILAELERQKKAGDGKAGRVLAAFIRAFYANHILRIDMHIYLWRINNYNYALFLKSLDYISELSLLYD